MMDDSRMERRMRQNRESSERSNMMDDSMDNTIKTYLFGSLGQAKYNLKQSIFCQRVLAALVPMMMTSSFGVVWAIC